MNDAFCVILGLAFSLFRLSATEWLMVHVGTNYFETFQRIIIPSTFLLSKGVTCVGNPDVFPGTLSLADICKFLSKDVDLLTFGDIRIRRRTAMEL